MGAWLWGGGGGWRHHLTALLCLCQLGKIFSEYGTAVLNRFFEAIDTDGNRSVNFKVRVGGCWRGFLSERLSVHGRAGVHASCIHLLCRHTIREDRKFVVLALPLQVCFGRS